MQDIPVQRGDFLITVTRLSSDVKVQTKLLFQNWFDMNLEKYGGDKRNWHASVRAHIDPNEKEMLRDADTLNLWH